MLDYDNLEGYRDTDTYDLLNKLDEAEWKFYLNLAVQQGGDDFRRRLWNGKVYNPFSRTRIRYYGS